MKRRLLAVLLAGAMAVALAACGNDGGADSGGQTEESKESGTESVSAEAREESGAQDPMDVSMMVCTKATQGDWNDYWVIKYIAERCGVQFHVDQVTADAWQEKKNLAFATQELPMVFLNDLTNTELAAYGAQGLILPLEDYITEENMPNFFKVINEDGYDKLLPSLYFPDGHIYAIRGINDVQRELAQSRFFINEAWAKKLGFEKLPSTLDEFYEYLCAVRDGDPNENGDTTDEIPLGGSYREDGTNTYFSNFVVILTAFGHVKETYEVDDSGKVIYVPEQEEYKEFLKYMNKLYTEKLLDQEYFIQTADQRKAKEASNLCGAFSDYASFFNVTDRSIYMQFRGMEPLTSQYNSTKMWPSADILYSGAMVLTKNVEDEETIKKILSVADWCYSQEGMDATLSGPKIGQDEEYPEYGWELDVTDTGIQQKVWTYDEEGFESPALYKDYRCTPGTNTFPYAQTAERYGVTPITMEMYLDEDTGTSSLLTYDIMTNVYDYLKIGWPTTVKFTDEEADEISLIETDLKSYKETTESKMIMGELDIDATWDEFVDGLHARQLERYLEILQTAYDRWAGHN